MAEFNNATEQIVIDNTNCKVAKVSKYVEYNKRKHSHAINALNSMNLYNNNDEFDDYLRENVNLLANALIRGNRTPTSKDIITTLKSECNFIRITNDGIDNADCTDSISLMIYHFKQQVWVRANHLIESYVVAINDEIDDRLLNKIIQSLSRDKSIPLISNTASTVSNRATAYYELNDKKYFNIDINFANGQLLTKEHELLAIKPSSLVTNKLNYECPVNYSQKDKLKYFDLFESYFKSASGGDASKALTMKQVALCALLGINPGKQAINLAGQAGTGKSTFLALTVALAGGQENIAKLDYAKFNRDDMLEQIGNKRMVVGYDNDDNVVVKSLATLKTLLSHEPFTYSRKFKSAESNIFPGLVLQSFNTPPKFMTAGTNQPILDRMLLIEMNTRFRNTENDNRNLETQLTKPDVLGFMALYLLETVEFFDKFTVSNKSKDRAIEILDDNNPIKEFIAMLSDVGAFENEIIPVNHLYALYNDWQHINGWPDFQMTRFTNQLTNELQMFDTYDLEVKKCSIKYSSIVNNQQYDSLIVSDDSTNINFINIVNKYESNNRLNVIKYIFNANAYNIESIDDDIMNMTEQSYIKILTKLKLVFKRRCANLASTNLTTIQSSKIDFQAILIEIDASDDIEAKKIQCHKLVDIINQLED